MDTLLTVYSGAILGPIARVLGFVMNGIYEFFCLIAGGEANVGITIIMLTIIIYSALYPLTYKQQKFSRLSQKMNPEIKEIQKKYQGKRDQASMAKMQDETKAVYQKYGVSPTGSCLQMLIQMPILFALYRVFYNIPAYVNKVKEIFLISNGLHGNEFVANANCLVGRVMNTQGYMEKMTTLITNPDVQKTVAQVGANFVATNTTEQNANFIVDVLYKLNNDGRMVFEKIFGFSSSSVQSVWDSMDHVNNFGKLNISDTPMYYISNWWNNKSGQGLLLLAFLALLIPILSYVTQVLSVKVSQAGMKAAANADNPMGGGSMKIMNLLFPLMSFIICFSVPVGLGIYWIGSAVVRTVQMLYINKRLEKLNLEDIIEKNKEKLKKKREKMGISENQIRTNAALSTRSNVEFNSSLTEEEREKRLNEAAEMKKSATPGSMAAKANLVKEFNERNNKQGGDKK